MKQYRTDLYVEDLFFFENQQESPIQESQWQDWIEKWLSLLELDLDPQKTYEISLIFTDDQEIQSLNQQYRDKNQPTDVLSFAALETDFPDADFMDTVSLGDVIISVQTAQKQAQLQGHSLNVELVWLASHGFLHLLGWDHPDDNFLREMLTLQEFLLNSIGIQPPSVQDFFV
ncbi:rRNA maturation RNase YbeY [Geminocystis sp. NIES-3709]|uniref:rRNA maturation RNase YbeY n=1 Tax=Geminocystis sp. NIES-3709 TaxID=1617448 RepID=UPI0005FC7568|nr:rRNA maturation RNase YbeY [Geminocystis sp. NIES-3709]BAQ63809.1 metal-dependent hydrolase YbeY [Geminocystis sp. NIES-3709]